MVRSRRTGSRGHVAAEVAGGSAYACGGHGGAAALAAPWLRSGREREEERKEGRAHT